jgi:hypothetical protein
MTKLFWGVIVDMSNRCGISGNIYQGLDAIDIQIETEKRTGEAFEASFLGDVIDALDNNCFKFYENCKSQYPVVDKSNYTEWITSIDQDNKVSLAHVIEKSNVPILYNTPRLCDPGMTMSKNWSLKNYIETRLYDFKFTYNMGKNLINNTNNSRCFPQVILDFRPFKYVLELPNPKGVADTLYVTEWLTVDPNTTDFNELGYNPHIKVSKKPFDKKYTTESIFIKMIKGVMNLPYGASNRSLVKNVMNLGTSGINENTFISSFISFLKKIDGLTYLENLKNNKNNKNTIQKVVLESDVIAVLYYDLYHDSIFKKSHFPLSEPITNPKRLEKIPGLLKRSSTKSKTFRSVFKDEFKKVQESVYDGLVGKGIVKNSFDNYGPRIFLRPKPEVIPAIFKTLGDLSQFMYAARYNTVVASGDKMGIGVGIYINAKKNRRVKCLIEDAVTGFIIYSGFSQLEYTSIKSCIKQKSAACRVGNTSSNKNVIAQKVRRMVSNNAKPIVEKLIAAKPKLPSGIKRTIKLWLNQDLNRNTAMTVLNTIEKFIEYWDDSDREKIIRVLDTISRNKSNVGSRAAVLRGRVAAGLTVATPNRPNNPKNRVIGQKRGRNTPNRQNNQRPTQTPRPNNRMNTNNRRNQTTATATPRPNNRMNTNNRRNQTTATATPRPNNRRNQTTATATPRPNNRRNQTTATATPRPNNRRNQTTATPNNRRNPTTATPRQNNRGNPTTTTPRPNNSNRSNLTRTTRSGTLFGQRQRLKNNYSYKPNGSK